VKHQYQKESPPTDPLGLWSTLHSTPPQIEGTGGVFSKKNKRGGSMEKNEERENKLDQRGFPLVEGPTCPITTPAGKRWEAQKKLKKEDNYWKVNILLGKERKNIPPIQHVCG